jgi:diguanylate cyclase (GGDEF)-like protein
MGIINRTREELLNEGNVIIVGDTQNDKRADKYLARKLGVGSYANVIFEAYGELLGYMHLCRSIKEIEKGKLERFSKDDRTFLGLLGGDIAVSLHNRRLYEQKTIEARTDYLTELPNRRMFTNLLGQKMIEAKDSGGKLSLMMSDIDNFKKVVDTYGHWQGSKVIHELAKLLRGSLKPEYEVSNYAGDEFIFMLPNTSVSEAKELSDKLRKTVSEYKFSLVHPETKLSETYQITFCFGMAEWEHPSSIEELIERADYALNRAKKQEGKNSSLAYNTKWKQ